MNDVVLTNDPCAAALNDLAAAERERDEAVALLREVEMGLDDYWVTIPEGVQFLTKYRAFLARINR
jgi:hypothetical protein